MESRPAIPPGWCVVVVDDDPTGVQTVAGNLLLTAWEEEDWREALADPVRFCYALGNTRACSPREAAGVVGAILAGLGRAVDPGAPLLLVSRADSTLRGHFPLEVEALRVWAEGRWGAPADATFVAPALLEGGRVTADDVHYLVDGAGRRPVGETEFAHDPVFPYRHSRLPEWVEEKTAGRVRADQVESLSLELLRGPVGALEARLDGLSGRRWVVVNAEHYGDLARFAEACWRSLQRGKRFLVHSSSSLARALCGCLAQPATVPVPVPRAGRGLVVAGSFVDRTSAQLRVLLARPDMVGQEVAVESALADPVAARDAAVRAVDRAWREGRTPVLYTSRLLCRAADPDGQRRLGRALSGVLVEIVRHLPGPPGFLLTKGGITSHEILTRALEVRRARVLGALLPGVPAVSVAWRGQPLPLVIFPGNVGGPDSLAEACARLQGGPADPPPEPFPR